MPETGTSRREFLAAAASMPWWGRAAFSSQLDVKGVPVRAITRGPGHHWFGYYDKLQFSVDDRHVLGAQVEFEHRTPRDGDRIRIGVVDLEKDDEWIELGESRAWGWQQGCMLQWRPGESDEVLWNDREGDAFVCRVFDRSSGERRTLPHPIYTVSPDGRFALGADFARIQVMRPGYGYVGLEDPHAEELAPEAGVYSLDLESGVKREILTLAEVAKVPHRGRVLEDVWHYFNHLLIAPDSKRFLVLHRWRKRHSENGRPTGGFTTRMFSASVDGGELYLLDPSGYTSHFIWRDPEYICAWTKPEGKPAAFWLLRDRTQEIEPVGEGVMTRNGHLSYLPGADGEWILNDTYPDRERLQHPYLFHVPSARKIELGAFHSPPAYRGEWRCDTHPRASRDGRSICIDSPHDGNGRQLHLLDITTLLE